MPNVCWKTFEVEIAWLLLEFWMLAGAEIVGSDVVARVVVARFVWPVVALAFEPLDEEPDEPPLVFPAAAVPVVVPPVTEVPLELVFWARTGAVVAPTATATHTASRRDRMVSPRN